MSAWRALFPLLVSFRCAFRNISGAIGRALVLADPRVGSLAAGSSLEPDAAICPQL